MSLKTWTLESYSERDFRIISSYFTVKDQNSELATLRLETCLLTSTAILLRLCRELSPVENILTCKSIMAPCELNAYSKSIHSLVNLTNSNRRLRARTVLAAACYDISVNKTDWNQYTCRVYNSNGLHKACVLRLIWQIRKWSLKKKKWLRKQAN